MYHALVFDPVTEKALSLKLHAPGPAWSKTLRELKERYGAENVGYTFCMEETPSYASRVERILDETERASVAFKLLHQRDASVLSEDWESGVMPLSVVMQQLVRGDYVMPPLVAS